MSGLVEKCSVCRALIDEEDVFCANCGTEVPQQGQEQAPTGTSVVTHNFGCEGCGASMSYDASAGSLRCPFCGSEKLSQQNDAKTLKPSGVISFQITQDSALQQMRLWLGQSSWRPSDLARTASVSTMTPVYVPYWIFQAWTRTYWTADTSRTPPGARASWYPISGEHRGAYSGLLVGASGALAPKETWALCPFDLGDKVDVAQVDLENAIVEQFRVQRKYARPQARVGFEQLVREACSNQVPGQVRNLHVNMRLEGLSSEPVLLPVWIMAYTYNNQLFRFLVNGQTGRATGEAPLSYKKIAAAVGIGVGVVVVLLVVLLLILAGR
jgi:predicted RNA-binding Zn-ribbon protein involved in translation (DUF1610 family)